MLTFAPSNIASDSQELLAFCVVIMKEFAKAFYKSSEWQKCRASYIKSVNGLCERCLQRGLIVPGYIVHHKCYLTPENILDPSVTLNFDNLEFLCHDCHNREHGRTKIPKRYEILPDGGVRTDPPIFSNMCTDS